jgi:hypothetical protein
MKRRKVINFFTILIFVIAIGLGICFYYKLNKIQNNSNQVREREVDVLVSKVSDLYLIPLDERPTIATVSDPLALKDKSFFKQSEKGDKVLIFTKAGRAVLYRPRIDKIIEVAPIRNNQLSSEI